MERVTVLHFTTAITAKRTAISWYLNLKKLPRSITTQKTLGSFLNANADEVTKRFLVEQLPNQRKALDSIEWDKAPDFTEFSRNAEQVKKLIAGLQGDEKAKNEKELAAIQKEYEAAKAMNDQNAYAKALDKLRKLQKAIGSSALNSLM